MSLRHAKERSTWSEVCLVSQGLSARPTSGSRGRCRRPNRRTCRWGQTRRRRRGRRRGPARSDTAARAAGARGLMPRHETTRAAALQPGSGQPRDVRGRGVGGGVGVDQESRPASEARQPSTRWPGGRAARGRAAERREAVERVRVPRRSSSRRIRSGEPVMKTRTPAAGRLTRGPRSRPRRRRLPSRTAAAYGGVGAGRRGTRRRGSR